MKNPELGPNIYQNLYVMKVALQMEGNDGLITDVGKLGSHLENKFILSVGPVYKINFRWIGRNYSVILNKNTTLECGRLSKYDSKPKSITEQINTTLRK